MRKNNPSDADAMSDFFLPLNVGKAIVVRRIIPTSTRLMGILRSGRSYLRISAHIPIKDPFPLCQRDHFEHTSAIR